MIEKQKGSKNKLNDNTKKTMKWKGEWGGSAKEKEKSEKVGLELNIQITNIMASGPITSWEMDGETVETVSDFIFLGSKITADGDLKDAYSLEGKLWPT